jgi:hypothetical protein
MSELDNIKSEEEEIEHVISILQDMYDEEECWYDHHGYCQAHNWFGETLCPHKRAQEYLERRNNERS